MYYIRNIILVALLVSAIGQISATPGATLVVSQSGINEAQNIAVPILQNQLNKIAVPDLHTKVHVAVIGNIDIDITNIQLSGITFQTAVKIVPSTGIAMTISNLAATVNANWHYKEENWPHIGDSGTVVASVSNTQTDLVLDISNNNGHPVITLTQDDVTIGSLSVELHGGASWLYQVILDLFSGSIKSDIEGAIKQGLSTAINTQVANFLANFPFVLPIDKNVKVDFTLSDDPLFTSALMAIFCKGELLALKNPVEYPIPPPALPAPAADKMIRITVTDYTFGSAAAAYYQSGIMHVTFTNKNIPANFPVSLNTSSWQYLLPNLYYKYPNLAMQIDVQASQTPGIVINSTGVTSEVSGLMIISVINSQQQVIPCVTISIDAALTVNVKLNSTSLIPSLLYDYSSITLKNSTVGPVYSISFIGEMVTFVIQNIGVPMANVVLSRGFPLPIIPGTDLVNTDLSFQDRYLVIDTDFTTSTTHVATMVNGLNRIAVV
jgi:lipopolysaccharide-binding protein